MRDSLIIGIILLSFSVSPLTQADNPDPLKAGEQGRVLRIIDGDSLHLDNGLKVRLAGISAPRLPKTSHSGHTPDHLGVKAADALEKLTLGKNLRLYYAGATRDRYGRALAQVYTLDTDHNPHTWIQEALLRQGFARVYTWPDTHQNTQRLYAAEQEARKHQRGIWKLPAYAIRSPDPDPLAQYIDSFQIIEGIIISTADIRGHIYLNFGANYRTDFTITIKSQYKKRFLKAGIDLLSLEGARVRVRGWVELYNGPMVWIDHPERLEILTP